MPEATPIWTYHAPDQSPAAAATVFAAKYFGEPREPEGVWGRWAGGGKWTGNFRPKGGRRTYRLDGLDGGWVVSVEAEGGGEA